MKKNRKFNLKVAVLICLTIFSNCSNDENILKSIESDAYIETVSIDDAKNLFQDIDASPSLFSKFNGQPFVTPHLNEINQETIENSEELITLIPSTTSLGENQNSRIVLLKIDGEIKSVVFNMISTDQEDNEDFTGNIIVTELDGTFLNGYRVDKGKTVALLAKSESSKKNAKSNVLAKSNNNCQYSDPFWCSYYNSNSLREVTITVTLPSTNHSSYSSTYNRDFNTINILNIYSNSNSSMNYNHSSNYSSSSYSWNYGAMGGSTASSSSSISTSLINTLNSSNSSSNALTAAQKSWISNYRNLSKVTSLNNYLKQNQYSSSAYEVAKAFAKEAVNALVNNGEIDLDNRLIYNPVIAQDYKSRMSPSEVEIFETLNAATKLLYLKAATNAYIYAETHFPRPVRNTKGDTFKHTFWNAISTVYIGETLTKQLTDAHEDIAYDPNYTNHYKETQMDLYNNAKGRQIAYGSGRLYRLVQSALDNGNLRYLNNLVFINGFWNATNSSVLTPTNQ